MPLPKFGVIAVMKGKMTCYASFLKHQNTPRIILFYTLIPKNRFLLIKRLTYTKETTHLERKFAV